MKLAQQSVEEYLGRACGSIDMSVSLLNSVRQVRPKFAGVVVPVIRCTVAKHRLPSNLQTDKIGLREISK